MQQEQNLLSNVNFAHRCIRFASKDLEHALLLASTTTSFREAIIDYGAIEYTLNFQISKGMEIHSMYRQIQTSAYSMYPSQKRSHSVNIKTTTSLPVHEREKADAEALFKKYSCRIYKVNYTYDDFSNDLTKRMSRNARYPPYFLNVCRMFCETGVLIEVVDYIIRAIERNVKTNEDEASRKKVMLQTPADEGFYSKKMLMCGSELTTVETGSFQSLLVSAVMNSKPNALDFVKMLLDHARGDRNDDNDNDFCEPRRNFLQQFLRSGNPLLALFGGDPANINPKISSLIPVSLVAPSIPKTSTNPQSYHSHQSQILKILFQEGIGKILIQPSLAYYPGKFACLRKVINALLVGKNYKFDSFRAFLEALDENEPVQTRIMFFDVLADSIPHLAFKGRLNAIKLIEKHIPLQKKKRIEKKKDDECEKKNDDDDENESDNAARREKMKELCERRVQESGVNALHVSVCYPKVEQVMKMLDYFVKHLKMDPNEKTETSLYSRARISVDRARIEECDLAGPVILWSVARERNVRVLDFLADASITGKAPSVRVSIMKYLIDELGCNVKDKDEINNNKFTGKPSVLEYAEYSNDALRMMNQPMIDYLKEKLTGKSS